jgi:hypothetical protein
MTDHLKDLLTAVTLAAALFVLLSYGMGVLL